MTGTEQAEFYTDDEGVISTPHFLAPITGRLVPSAAITPTDSSGFSYATPDSIENGALSPRQIRHSESLKIVKTVSQPKLLPHSEYLRSTKAERESEPLPHSVKRLKLAKSISQKKTILGPLAQRFISCLLITVLIFALSIGITCLTNLAGIDFSFIVNLLKFSAIISGLVGSSLFMGLSYFYRLSKIISPEVATSRAVTPRAATPSMLTPRAARAKVTMPRIAMPVAASVTASVAEMPSQPDLLRIRAPSNATLSRAQGLFKPGLSGLGALVPEGSPWRRTPGRISVIAAAPPSSMAHSSSAPSDKCCSMG